MCDLNKSRRKSPVVCSGCKYYKGEEGEEGEICHYYKKYVEININTELIEDENRRLKSISNNFENDRLSDRGSLRSMFLALKEENKINFQNLRKQLRARMLKKSQEDPIANNKNKFYKLCEEFLFELKRDEESNYLCIYDELYEKSSFKNSFNNSITWNKATEEKNYMNYSENVYKDEQNYYHRFVFNTESSVVSQNHETNNNITNNDIIANNTVEYNTRQKHDEEYFGTTEYAEDYFKKIKRDLELSNERYSQRERQKSIINISLLEEEINIREEIQRRRCSNEIFFINDKEDK